MSPWLRIAAAVGCLGALPPAQEPSDLETFVTMLVDQDWQWWSRPPVGARCVQFSSHDPRSDAGPADPGAWYANDDRGHYLRIVERAGRKEHVLVDVEGPGVLVRLWSANPTGTLFFDVDGARVWTVDFAALCAGEVDGVPAPFAATCSRGGNVYLPVPFAKHLTISATAGDLYYLADVARLGDGEPPVVSFRPEQLTQHAESLTLLARTLAEIGPDASGIAALGPRRVDVPAGHQVQSLLVRVRRTEPGADLGAALGGVRLVVHAGEERTVDVPVTDFFASRDWRPWRSYMLSVGDDGTGCCLWRMPMPDGGRLELACDVEPAGVDLSLDVSYEELFAKQPLLFRASYHLAKGVATRPFSDHVVLDALGAGRFVGCSLLVRNPSRVWWGEGDEKVWVDGEARPSWFGTGTEDYFGYAWCDPTPFQAPFHAQVRCDGPMNYGFTQLFRAHALDAIPFRQSIRFEFERWHWVEDAQTDYATVAYWYGAPGAKSSLPPVPSVADRRLEPLPPPKMFVAERVLEGETLRVVSCDGGVHEVQDLSFFEGRFSRDAHRWWRDGAVGDALVLAVPVPDAGRYRVTLAMTRADDFGVVQVSLGGQALGDAIDLYAESVGPSGPMDRGVVELAAGDAELRLELVGQNPKAKPRRMVGLDYVKLEKVE